MLAQPVSYVTFYAWHYRGWKARGWQKLGSPTIRPTPPPIFPARPQATNVLPLPQCRLRHPTGPGEQFPPQPITAGISNQGSCGTSPPYAQHGDFGPRLLSLRVWAVLLHAPRAASDLLVEIRITSRTSSEKRVTRVCVCAECKNDPDTPLFVVDVLLVPAGGLRLLTRTQANEDA